MLNTGRLVSMSFSFYLKKYHSLSKNQLVESACAIHNHPRVAQAPTAAALELLLLLLLYYAAAEKKKTFITKKRKFQSFPLF